MSPIGRIFVVINLALSGLFLGWAASNLSTAQKYRTNYETELDAKAELKRSLEEDIASLNAAKAEAERMRADAVAQKQNLETQKAALQLDIDEKSQELTQLKEQSSNIDDQIANLADSVKSMSSEVTAANEAKASADEARYEAEQAMQAAVAKADEAQDQVNGLMKQIADLEMDLTSTNRELASATTMIEVAKQKTGLTEAELTGSAPLIEGAVLQVSMEVGNGLVHINRGQNDNVKKGYVFDIFAGGTYKGRARVDIVNASTCTARILDTMPGTTIMQGDRASTQI